MTGRLRTRNRRSGATTDVPGAWVYTLRDGLIVRVEAFGDPADALAALGPDTLVA
ncbi:MAG: nuclear transport factor 2 family protein [Solirubrobacteraceae bacterium]